MYNKYYRLNESRWELPEEGVIFKYPDYGLNKKDHNLLKEKNLKEGWDKHIIEELTKFYNENKAYIITEYDKLEEDKDYFYIDFSYFTPDDLNIIHEDIIQERRFKEIYFEDEDKTYEVRKVIRKYPELNPSNILFFGYLYSPFQLLSRKLSCVIKEICFNYNSKSLEFMYINYYYKGGGFC